MKSLRYALAVLTLVGMSACKKGDKLPISTTIPDKPKVLTIRWKELQMQAQLSYHADQNLQRMTYRQNGTLVNESVFIYNADQRLAELANSALAEKQLFTYNSTGQLIRQDFVLKDGGTYHARKRLDYTNDAAGRLHQLNYFIINEAGSTLQQSNRYAYDNAGRLLKINVEDRNNNQYVISIASYSASVQFDPLYLLFQELDENYPVYNLALLRQLRQLPAQIRRYQLVNGVLSPIKVHTLDYDIEAGRLKQQLTTTVSINPAVPVMELTAEFLYD